MKSAYELAMERLSKSAPAVKLTAAQKKDIAEADSICAAKLAEREIFLKGQIAKSIETGDIEAIEQIERQIASEKRRLQTELEEKKEKIRSGKS
jgi:hypothetical protein